MRRVAALVAIVVLGLFVLAGLAAAGQDATGQPATAQASGQPAAPSQQSQQGPVRLDLAAMTPRVVTGSGPAELVVTGTVTNTGPAQIDSLGVRAQRGPAADSEASLRSALDGEGGADEITPAFTDLGTLAPGMSLPFRYAVPLTGDPTRTLALASTGTYPLLINVNGSTGGERARLATARMLLPVSGLPGASRPEPETQAPFAMLYPITDPPHRIPPVPGQVPVLTDDDLAASFGPGGRLRGLVDALAAQAPTGSPVRAATCLAIDPELVATAVAMRGGYGVVSGPDGQTVPGRGADAAGRWLDDLKAAARGSCVLAVPSSDADLVALVRGGEADLARAAVEQGRAGLARDLETTVLDGAVWPSGGVLDEPTLEALNGPSSVLLSADGLGQTDAARTSGVVPIAGVEGGTRAVITDPLLTEAATGPVGRDGIGGRNPEVPAGGSGPMSSQDLVGALGFRAEAGPGPGPLVVAPPHRWSADGSAGAALLSGAASLIGEGRLAPAGLAAVATTGTVTDAGTARLYYPVQAGGQEISAGAVTAVAEQDRSIGELQAAAEGRTGVGATPAEVFDPLRLGTLRAVSTVWRGRPDMAERDADMVATRIEGLRSSVRVLEPPSPYSLGTSDAPLLLTVANGLPVTMNVRIVLSSTSGLRVAPIPAQAVPPLGRVQVRVSAQVTRAGQFSVDAGLRTPDGATLGPDTRLRVRSTVYGTVTVWLTAIAGAVLVVLVTRRVLRRIRPGGGPGDGPGPGGAGPDRGPLGPSNRRRPTDAPRNRDPVPAGAAPPGNRPRGAGPVSAGPAGRGTPAPRAAGPGGAAPKPPVTGPPARGTNPGDRTTPIRRDGSPPPSAPRAPGPQMPGSPTPGAGPSMPGGAPDRDDPGPVGPPRPGRAGRDDRSKDERDRTDRNLPPVGPPTGGRGPDDSRTRP